jgi:hypothetical protein
MFASIRSLQLAAHQPWRDVVAEPRPESLRGSDHGRQGLELDNDTDGAWLDGLRPKWFDKADFGSDRVHDFANKRPRVERGHELLRRPLSISTHPPGWAAATESVYFTCYCRDSSTAEHQLRLLKTEVRLLHSAPVRREANGPLLVHIRLTLRKHACDVSTEKPQRCRAGSSLGTCVITGHRSFGTPTGRRSPTSTLATTKPKPGRRRCSRKTRRGGSINLARLPELLGKTDWKRCQGLSLYVEDLAAFPDQRDLDASRRTAGR